jgi:subtilisin family serine protease
MRRCTMRAKLVMGLLTVFLVLGLFLPGCAIFPQGSGDRAQTLASDIQVLRQRADEDGRVAVVIKLEGASLGGIEEKDVVGELKKQAAQSQKNVVEFLKTKGAIVLNTFWLTNAILADVPVGLLDEFISFTKVERLFENFKITIPEPLEEESLPGILSATYTWGLEKIGAPGVWDMGITGSGVRVAVLDTGVDISHPDLAGKMWTDNAEDPTYPGGWIEFDSYGDIIVGSTPHDTHGHGTHTSGTVLGGDASGIAIGVAPEAWLMHGLVVPWGSGTWAQIIAGMEWAIDPFDQYGGQAGEPADVISMSLGAAGYYDAFIEPVQNIKAAGIVLSASIGNDGEGISGSPGNVYDAFGIGATDIEDLVAYFSGGEVVDWPASHPEPYIKPDFSAPGVGVYSSIPGGYDYYQGTSMAAPHVAGTVALMLQGNPELTVEDVYGALQDTAVDLGDEGQDTRYGWGRIDAFEAVSLVTLDSGIEGFVTDAETAEPLEGARMFVSETGKAKYSDDSGYYRFFLPPGIYNVNASAFGHYQGNATVEVVGDAFILQSFALEPMPTGLIEGTVTDAETEEPIEGVIITLPDTPLGTATNETGEYSVEAPIGAYDVRAWAWGHRPSVVPDVDVAENETTVVNFTLEPVLAMAAVLGDYESQLADLLLANDIWAEQRGWDLIDDIDDYDVVVVNRPSDPGESTFLEFLEAASANQTRVIFTSSYPAAGASYGISLLQWYLGDPAGQSYDYWSGDVYYQVREAHSIFEGWEAGSNITIINTDDCDHAWFWDYSGYTVGDVGSEDYGIRGDAVALGVYGESLHVLLAGLAPQYYTNVPDWTDDAKTIFVRAVVMPLDDLVVITTKLPIGMVGAEYEATLAAWGGTKPYTWAVINGTLPDGLELDTGTGAISGMPTEAGAFNFTVEITDAAEAIATRELSIPIIVLTEFITDPLGDQFYGYGPDIVGTDFYRDEAAIYFRVRTAEPIDFDDTVNYMWLDLDLNAHTGYVSPYPEVLPTNDIGADAVALVLPQWMWMMKEDLSLPLQIISDERQLETEPGQASSGGLLGVLLLWDSDYGGFYPAGYFPVLTDTDDFWFGVALDMLEDDGIMAVADVIGDPGEPTDVAPNEGHGITGEGPDLAIADKWEEWLDQDEDTYRVHYVVKNQGNVAVPAIHETALIVDGFQLETKLVPVELAPGQEYSGSFSTIVTISPPSDEIMVCADCYDVVDELSEENNCLTNILWPEPAWTEFISDPAGDQFYDYGPDIEGVDFGLDETTVYFRVRTAEPIEPYDTVNYMLLDLDQNASTGFVSYDTYIPTNDIGADAYALILPEWIMGEELSLPLQITGDGRQLETAPVQALSGGLVGWLLLWDPYYEGFYYAGEFPVFTGTDYFWFAIPLDVLEDDGIMDVVDVIGSFSEPTDVAPNEGHGRTGTQRMGCFIATAAYGTPMAEEIQILREFRDEYLLTNPLGRALVNFYYEVSPPIAEFITEHPSLKPIVRAVLLPTVAVSTLAVNTTAAQKAAMVGPLVLVLVGGVAVWATRRRNRGPAHN